MDTTQFFNEHYEEFKVLVGKRRHKWRATSIMEWEDLESRLLTRIFRQLSHYDETRPLDRWANRLVSNEIRNVLRDKIYKDARPCVSGQAPGFNMGSSYGRGCACALANGGCSWTKSGKQDSSCKFMKAWEQKKQAKFAISTPLSIENHFNESQSMPDDFFDIEAAKTVIDQNIQRRLTKDEYRVYVFMYVQHLSIEEAAKQMGFKKRDENDQKGYMHVRTASLVIKEVVKQIISEQGLVR